MANFTKFFRNGKTFSAYCRMRYGQSQDIWADTSLWEKRGRFAIAFDEEAADELFPPRNMYKPAHLPAMLRGGKMAAYIHSGCGLDNYYEDRDAGYAY